MARRIRGAAFKFSPSGTFTVINKIPTVSYGPLLQASDGNFYGVTEFGGTFSAGTIYKIAGSTVTTLYNFDGTHGSYPIGGLVQGADGNLYGTTTAGGTTNAGVIYKITTAGKLTVLVNFDNVNTLDCYQAFAGLIAGSDGNLYGATIWGGTSGYGEIFQMTTSGAYTALYNFVAASGDGAYSTPMQHTSGKLFGLTTRGGVDGKGGIYSYDSGIGPFVSLVSTLGPVGATVSILGSGFAATTSVQFNGTPASFHVVSNTYLTATVPSGETGFVSVTTASGRLSSNKIYRVTPQIKTMAPTSGSVGSTVALTGFGLISSHVDHRRWSARERVHRELRPAGDLQCTYGRQNRKGGPDNPRRQGDQQHRVHGYAVKRSEERSANLVGRSYPASNRGTFVTCPRTPDT